MHQFQAALRVASQSVRCTECNLLLGTESCPAAPHRAKPKFDKMLQATNEVKRNNYTRSNENRRKRLSRMHRCAAQTTAREHETLFHRFAHRVRCSHSGNMKLPISCPICVVTFGPDDMWVYSDYYELYGIVNNEAKNHTNKWIRE